MSRLVLKHNNFALKEQVVIITGAASGIGREMTETFLSHDAYVWGLDIHELPYQHPHLNGITLDISNETEVNHAIEVIIKKHGRIDVLINNAGIQIISPLSEYDYQDWKKIFGVQLDGTFFLTKACMKEMKKNNNINSIINIGSIYSFESAKNKSAYITAKHGLVGLTRAIAAEGAEYNIKANLVAPGFVRTPLVEKQIPELAKTLGLSEEEVIQKIMLSKTVDGKFTTTKEVTEAVLFFVTFPSLALTGQSLLVSHGQNMS